VADQVVWPVRLKRSNLVDIVRGKTLDACGRRVAVEVSAVGKAI
jgi:hypothetical protein